MRHLLSAIAVVILFLTAITAPWADDAEYKGPSYSVTLDDGTVITLHAAKCTNEAIIAHLSKAIGGATPVAPRTAVVFHKGDIAEACWSGATDGHELYASVRDAKGGGGYFNLRMFTRLTEGRTKS